MRIEKLSVVKCLDFYHSSHLSYSWATEGVCQKLLGQRLKEWIGCLKVPAPLHSLRLR